MRGASAVKKALLDAESEGIISVFPPHNHQVIDTLSAEWAELFTDIGGFSLINGLGEFCFFKKTNRAVDDLMPNRLDLTEDRKWGWFCQINSCGRPDRVWYFSDCFCHLVFRDFHLWVEAILNDHRNWLELWKENDCPTDSNEQKWDALIQKFDTLSLENSVDRHHDLLTIRRSDLLDFREAVPGDYLDLRWNLSPTGEENVFCRRRHSLIQRIGIFFGRM